MCHHFPARNMQKHLFSRWRVEVSNSVLDPEQTVQCCSNFKKVMKKVQSLLLNIADSVKKT